MNNSEKKKGPIRVEELSNFPFDNFKTFSNAAKSGMAFIGIDMSIAREWTFASKSCPVFLRFLSRISHLIPWLILIAIIIFSIIKLHFWYLFLIIPVIISFLLLSPLSLMKGLRKFIVGLSYIGIVFSVFIFIPAIFWISLIFIIIWNNNKFLYYYSSKVLRKKVVYNEELLCLLYHARALNVRLDNGETYWTDLDEEGRKKFRHLTKMIKR